MRSLTGWATLTVPVDVTYTLTSINSAGTATSIVELTGTIVASATVVPEPSTWALLGVSLAGPGVRWLARRRRRSVRGSAVCSL